MDSVQNQTENSQHAIISKVQELYKQQQRKNLQQCEEEDYKIFFDRPIVTSDIEDNNTTLSTPNSKETIKCLNVNKDDNKEIRRLSTTDSMQEFLEIPDHISNDSDTEDEEESKDEKKS